MMFNESEMKRVPAYFAENHQGERIPFIVALMMLDDQHQPVLPPAVAASVDKTLGITGAQGVALANIFDRDVPGTVVPRYLDRAMGIPGALVLFRCESPETAERVMGVIDGSYTLSLVKDHQAARDE